MLRFSGDQALVRYWIDRQHLLDESIEQLAAMPGRPPVEAERKLVQIIIEMVETDRSLMRTEQPSFQE